MPSDYQVVPLSPVCNAGVAALGAAPAPTLGPQTMRGLPFDVGTDPGRCFVRPGPGPVRVELPRPGPVSWVIVAHRVIDSRVLAGGPVGEVVGTYTFHHRSGRRCPVPIRERFEVSIVQTERAEWGQLPMLAVPSRFEDLPPREHGSFASFGHRLTELEMVAADFYLWAWQSPDPDDPPVSVELAAGPADAGLLIAGITLGTAPEHPLRLPPARPVTVTAADPPPGQRLSVTVDRGVSTFAQAARPGPGDPADPLTGWGGDRGRDGPPAYAMVSALPSATLSVAAGEQVLAETGWGELTDRGRIDRRGLRVEVVESGRNWVRTSIVDDDTDRPVPCRIHFRSLAGVPYQPHGHPNHLNSDLYEYKAKLGIRTGTWGIDFGGDVRLGGVTYAYVDGRCEGWLPRGQVVVEAARGFEYEPVRQVVTVQPGQRELTVRLKRRSDLTAQGWFSGDTHVHFLSVGSAHLEAAGEDLNVVNLLATQWGSRFSSTDQFTGAPSVSADGRTIVSVSQENRQHILGHLALLGLTEPVMPWCTDGPPEAAMGSALETTLAHWADSCHQQGGLVVLPHFPNPNGEVAALVATGRVDAVEFAEFLPYSHHQYYRYLNAGYRLPVVGGTDKMSGDVPVGLYRTYARIPPGEPFTYAAWCEAVLAGRTFMSSGPLIFLTVEGQPIGSTVRLPAGGGMVHVEAAVSSIFPVHTLEIVMGGRVVASASSREGTGSLAVSEAIRVPADTWIAARSAGPRYSAALRHRDEWERAVMAHTSPVYLSSGERWLPGDRTAYAEMLAMIDGGLAYIRQLSPRWDDQLVTHHHGHDDHRRFLERPFHEARQAIATRLDSLP